MEPIVVSWSGGKDSAFALYRTLIERKYEVKTLFTTISAEYNRVSMHGVRRKLLERQAKSIKMPLRVIRLPKDVSMEKYESIMRQEMNRFKSKDINNVIFGDIFLEDVRKYRETNLSKIGMNALFPLWDKSSQVLAKEFLDLGFKAIITCVDSTYLDGSFIGRMFNEQFLSSIPSNVDPCGENGEFHTFVFDGPIFSRMVQFKKAEIMFRGNRFYFIDLV
jgi:uncharacterized protein (TIGR00290 family)